MSDFINQLFNNFYSSSSFVLGNSSEGNMTTTTTRPYLGELPNFVEILNRMYILLSNFFCCLRQFPQWFHPEEPIKLIQHYQRLLKKLIVSAKRHCDTFKHQFGSTPVRRW